MGARPSVQVPLDKYLCLDRKVDPVGVEPTFCDRHPDPLRAYPPFVLIVQAGSPPTRSGARKSFSRPTRGTFPGRAQPANTSTPQQASCVKVQKNSVSLRSRPTGVRLQPGAVPPRNHRWQLCFAHFYAALGAAARKPEIRAEVETGSDPKGGARPPVTSTRWYRLLSR